MPPVHVALVSALLFGEGDVRWLKQTWSSQWLREPTADEFKGLVDDLLNEKVIAREAQAIDISADPELAVDLLEPFKSQGISDVEDGTLVIRAKFKAKAGKQTMIRRTALTAVHKAFQENGIKAVPKPLTAAAAPA